jgi:malonate-semialdehyde dehydrogenase (acetylating)/methylmalonate-semialdehyde dehydrogenase
VRHGTGVAESGAAMDEVLPNFLGGAWVASAAETRLPVENPATGEVLVHAPRSTAAEIDRAVGLAREAFATWRRVPPRDRASVLSAFRQLYADRREDLARTITLENGKTLDEARAEVRRGLEVVDQACAAPSHMMGETIEDAAAGVDVESVRQPLGVFAAITSCDLPAIGPLWFWPAAVATGNAFVLKPSERTPLTQRLVFDLVAEAGFPAGVVNLVHGDREAAAALVHHPDVVGVSLIGTTAAARAVERLAAEHGKRIQAVGGARSTLVVMPDADLDRAVAAIMTSAFGCAGQRALAGSTVVAVGAVHDALVARLVERARALVVGDGLDPRTEMGPVVSGQALDRIGTILHLAERAGARFLVDGRRLEVKGRPRGHFVGPTVVTDVPPDAALATEEIFGPVLTIRRAADLDAALELVAGAPNTAAGAVFTASGRAAREFRYGAGMSLIGVNVGVPASAACFPFGGAGGSFLGDVKARGRDAIGFYTEARMVVARWT